MKIIQVGQKYGRLTAVRQVESKNQATRWECLCDCGKTAIVKSDNLKSGNTKSCGCLMRDQARMRCANRRTHGRSKTPEHYAWIGLKRRCVNPNNQTHKYYIDQGVTVCARWMTSFEAFLADVGLRPSPKHSLDRWPDPFGNYEPDNVRWATAEEQMHNRRDNVLVTIGGETHCVGAWEKIAGLRRETVRRRLKKGWPVERLLEPARKWQRAA